LTNEAGSERPLSGSTTRAPRTIVMSLCLFQAINGATWSCYFAYAGILFRQKFDLEIAQVAVLVSSFFLTYCVVQFVLSVLLDIGVQLIGLRRMLLRSPAAYILGLTVLIGAPSAPIAVAAGGIVGLGAASQPIVLSILFKVVQRQRSGFYASILGLSYLLGQVSALSMGWYIASRETVNIAFAIICISWLLLACFLGATVCIPSERGSAGLDIAPWHQRVKDSLRRMWALMVNPKTRALKVLMLVAGAAPALAGIYIPLYLLSVVGDSTRSAGYIALSTVIGYVIAGASTPALGAFADRKHNHHQLLLGILLFVALTVVAISRLHDPVMVSGLAVVFTIGGQWFSMLQNAILLLEASSDSPNTFFAVHQLPFYIGTPLALALNIGIITFTGSVPNTLVFVAGLFVAGALIWGQHVIKSRASLP